MNCVSITNNINFIFVCRVFIMKTVIVLFFVLTGFNVVNSELYTDKWDSVDLEEILNNRRLAISYIKCGLDQGPCTVDGLELKCEYFLGLM